MQQTSRTRGFTMIEILVVLVVVGLLAALAVANIGGGQQQRELDNEVSQLFMLMQTASDQAVMENAELGLKLEESAYRFLRLDELAEEWTVPSDRMFRQRDYPEWMIVEIIDSDFASSDSDSEEDELIPDLFFYSSGEVPYFELSVYIEGDPDKDHRILTNEKGRLTWLRPGEEKDW